MTDQALQAILLETATLAAYGLIIVLGMVLVAAIIAFIAASIPAKKE